MPLCNKDIFRKLKTYQKTKEISLWRIQSDIVRAGAAATEIVDSLFDHQSDSANSFNTKQAVRKLTDGLALPGNTFGALTNFRKELVVAGLHHDCKQLIKLSATPTWLFGETAEVSRKMKEIRDLHRIDKPQYSYKYDRHAAPKNGKTEIQETEIHPETPPINIQQKVSFSHILDLPNELCTLAYREEVPKIIDWAITECATFKDGRIRRYFSE